MVDGFALLDRLGSHLPDQQLRPVAQRRSTTTNHDLAVLIQNIKDGNSEEALAAINASGGVAISADDQGRTPLHYAAQGGCDEVVKQLLKLQASPDPQHHEMKLTPLHLSAKKGHRDVVKTLLEAGASPNLQNKFQRTALHYAADEGHHDVVKLLLDAGADRTIVDAYGYTPTVLASKSGQADVIQLFQRQPASRADPKEAAARRLVSLTQDAAKTFLCKNFHGTIWELKNGRGVLPATKSVFEIIYDSPSGNLRGEEVRQIIFLPANNVSLTFPWPSIVLLTTWVARMDQSTNIPWPSLTLFLKTSQDLTKRICDKKQDVHEARRVEKFVDKTFHRTDKETAHRRPHFSVRKHFSFQGKAYHRLAKPLVMACGRL